MDRIRAVTDNPGMVWTRELSDPATLGDEQRDEMYGLLLEHTTRWGRGSTGMESVLEFPIYIFQDRLETRSEH